MKSQIQSARIHIFIYSCGYCCSFKTYIRLIAINFHGSFFSVCCFLKVRFTIKKIIDTFRVAGGILFYLCCILQNFQLIILIIGNLRCRIDITLILRLYKLNISQITLMTKLLLLRKIHKRGPSTWIEGSGAQILLKWYLRTFIKIYV